MDKNNKWITVEGLDGSGKTSSVAYIKQSLESKGHRVHLVKAVGTGELGPVVRRGIFSGHIKDHMVPLALVLSILESHYEALEYIDKGYYVVTDRHIPSFFAYNCTAPDIYDSFEAHALSYTLFNYYFRDIRLLERRPDINIFLDVLPKTCKDRLDLRKNENEYTDNKPLDFFERLYFGYNKYYTTIDTNVVMLKNDGTIQDLYDDIEKIL